jgi:hypothetical protein
MTDQQHTEISERLATAKERDYVERHARVIQAPDAGIAQGMMTGPLGARAAIRSEISRLTGRIEELKALDRILPMELPPMAEQCVRNLVLGSVR